MTPHYDAAGSRQLPPRGEPGNTCSVAKADNCLCASCGVVQSIRAVFGLDLANLGDHKSHKRMPKELNSGSQSHNRSRSSAKRMYSRGRWTFMIATWNVRTLVERAGGDKRICRSRAMPSTSEGNVDRKIDLMTKELRRYSWKGFGTNHAGETTSDSRGAPTRFTVRFSERKRMHRYDFCSETVG